jgi:4-hydroxy-4-methyl-2-oxoglutarate aldolase
MTPPLTLDKIQALARLSTCTVANTIEEFRVRLRNEGFCDGSIRCMLPALPPIAGYAVTAKVRCSVPPAIGHSFRDRTEWWDSILRTPAPRIVVLEDVDNPPGQGALVGELHANIIRALGCVGCITNGAVRNLPEAEALKLHLFASTLAVSHAFAHLISLNEAVEIGGLRIQSGDLLHADQHGVLKIPHEIASDIPAKARENATHRQPVIDYCWSPGFSASGLRNLLRETE